MNYYYKYLKYKNKYLKLKQLGGAFNFEAHFNIIIQQIIDFNKEQLQQDNPIIAHIRGGSSIKYHLIKLGKEHENITSDIDILLIHNTINPAIKDTFLAYMKRTLDTLGVVTITQDGQLCIISIDNIQMIDITVYTGQDYRTETTSMDQAGINATFREIRPLESYVNNILNAHLFYEGDELVERITFTSIVYERASVNKGIENNENYINLIPSWRENLFKLQNKQTDRYDKYIKLTELLKPADVDRDARKFSAVKRQIEDLQKLAKADKIRIDKYIKQTSG